MGRWVGRRIGAVIQGISQVCSGMNSLITSRQRGPRGGDALEHPKMVQVDEPNAIKLVSTISPVLPRIVSFVKPRRMVLAVILSSGSLESAWIGLL